MRSRPWNSTPALASAAPTSAAPATRGRRIEKKMASSWGRQVGVKRGADEVIQGHAHQVVGPQLDGAERRREQQRNGQHDVRLPRTRIADGRRAFAARVRAITRRRTA